MKYLFLQLSIAMLLLTAISTAQTPPLSLQALQKNDYQSSLTALQTEIKTATEKKAVTFVQLTTLAIDLQKTQGWETDAGKALLTTVAPVADAGKLLSESQGRVMYLSILCYPILWRSTSLLRFMHLIIVACT